MMVGTTRGLVADAALVFVLRHLALQGNHSDKQN